MVLGYVKREIVLSPSFEKVHLPPGPSVRDVSTLQDQEAKGLQVNTGVCFLSGQVIEKKIEENDSWL